MWKKWIVVFALSAPLSAQNQRPNLYFSATSHALVATGRWVPSDPKGKAPFPSETEIDCDRQLRMCTEATAEYYSGHPHVSLTYLDIVRWDDDGIIATAPDAICVTTTILISFAEKSIKATDSLKRLSREKKEACNFVGATGAQNFSFVLKNSQEWVKDPYGESTGR